MKARKENSHHYRLYRLDRPGGEIVASRFLNCRDDEAAIVEALQAAERWPVELWDRGRIVMRAPRPESVEAIHKDFVAEALPRRGRQGLEYIR